MDQQDESCGICGEPLMMEDYRRSQDIAEMYDPKKPYEESVICHVQCGVDKNLEIA